MLKSVLGAAVGRYSSMNARSAGHVIASIEGAQKIEFGTLLESRAIGTIGEMIFDVLKPQC
jgi:hypothetical protein